MTKSCRAYLWSIACFVLLHLPLSTNAEEVTVEFSRAETLLWLTDQLKTIDRPMEFIYEFERSGTFEPGFKDTVRFIVKNVKDDGMKTASIEFFTGERAFDVPSAESTNVNPVLKIYLQGDVYEMNRLTDTDGKSKERWRYFQRRIKFSLAESAVVKEVKVSFGGKEYAAKEVSFSPYANDPKRALFEQFADKTYTVVVSDKLPGYLYSIKTVVPGNRPDSRPLIEEVLELAKVSERNVAPVSGG